MYFISILLTSQTTIAEHDYYSVVGEDEPSICEDVNGMVCQDETADGHKIHADYILMLGSILSAKIMHGIMSIYVKGDVH